MFYLVLLLVFGNLANFLLSQEHVLVNRSENPSNFLKWKGLSYHIYFGLVWVVKWLNTINFPQLLRLIDCFYIDSHSLGIVGILRIVAVKPSHTLFHAAAALLPEVNKGRHLCEVHEWNIINMSVALSFQNNSGWQAFVTHTLGEWFMIGTFVVHFIAELWKRYAILALLVGLMLSFTFRFHVRQEGFETFMLNKLIIFVRSDTVRALLKRAMIASVFNFFHVILSHT